MIFNRLSLILFTGYFVISPYVVGNLTLNLPHFCTSKLPSYHSGKTTNQGFYVFLNSFYSIEV